MLKNLFLSLVALTALAGTANANPFYAKVEAGVTANTEVEGFALSDDTTYGVSVGTAVGPIRVEGGVSSINADTFGADIGAVDWRVTGYADFAVSENTSVYAGAGLDYVQAEASFGPSSISVEGAGWHLAAGIARRVSNSMILEAQARYLDADLDGLDVSSTAFTVGTRIAL